MLGGSHQTYGSPVQPSILPVRHHTSLTTKAHGTSYPALCAHRLCCLVKLGHKHTHETQDVSCHLTALFLAEHRQQAGCPAVARSLYMAVWAGRADVHLYEVTELPGHWQPAES